MRITTLAVAGLLAASLSGCAAFDDGGSNASDGSGGTGEGGKVTVAAAFYPLAWTAEQVGGDHVDVTNLTQPGQEPHDLEMSVAATAAVSDAQLVIHETGLQPAVDDAVGEVATGDVLDAADVVDLLPFSEDDHEHSNDSAAGEPEEDHAHEEGSEEDGHDHDHGELDPHFWQDPARMAKLADAVAADLKKIDPDHADEYDANAATLTDELTAVSDEYTQGLASCERDTIVVSHDAFGYLAPYGLHVVGIAGLSPDAEPSAATLANLQELIKSDGITTVFGETLVSPKIAETLASDAGVTAAVLDPIEGLSDETAGEDYLSLMRNNLSALQTANGCA
jgi:zinc transport system substrate-binding protein